MAKNSDNSKKNISGRDLSLRVVMFNIFLTGVFCFLLVVISFVLQLSLFEQNASDIRNQVRFRDAAMKAKFFAEHNGGERPYPYSLGTYTVNLADIVSKHYLKISISLDIVELTIDNAAEKMPIYDKFTESIRSLNEKKKFEDDMRKYKPLVDDAVIMILSTKTSGQLLSKDGKELLKDQILNEVNAILDGDKEAIKVNFREFLIQ